MAFCLETMPRLSQLQRGRSCWDAASLKSGWRWYQGTWCSSLYYFQTPETSQGHWDHRRQKKIWTSKSYDSMTGSSYCAQTSWRSPLESNRGCHWDSWMSKLQKFCADSAESPKGSWIKRPPTIHSLLSARKRQNRLNSCRAIQAWTRAMWRRFLWSDESRLQCFWADGRQRVWRRWGECYHDAAIQPRVAYDGPSVMVWWGITFKFTGRTDLYVIQNNLNARRYCDEILIPIVIPFLNRQAHGRINF